MFSNQMPTESTLAISCLDSSICSARDMLFQMSVPYREIAFGGRKYLSGSNGASQSRSTIGPLSSRSEYSSRFGVRAGPLLRVDVTVDSPFR
ncbi:Uncharacterised protein [Mycobacteroides abscessus subsp. massiliense]|nr:Uncharacterised protein [Mycobacteroides abscessus subsp. massiliense]